MSIRSAFTRFISKHYKAQAATRRTMLSFWSKEVNGMPTRLVDKIELCTADTCGRNDWGDSVDYYDTHTFLQVYLEPTADLPEEVVLIERMESSEGVYHSVVPLPDDCIAKLNGTLRRPDIMDRVCVVSLGTAHHVVGNLNVERTMQFNGNLTVQDLATIFEFIGSMTRTKFGRWDCEHLARSFAFNCLAALAPNLPPLMPGVIPAYVAIFEDTSKRLMEHIPRMIYEDDESRTIAWMIQARRTSVAEH